MPALWMTHPLTQVVLTSSQTRVVPSSLTQHKLHHLIARDDEQFVLVVEDHA